MLAMFMAERGYGFARGFGRLAEIATWPLAGGAFRVDDGSDMPFFEELHVLLQALVALVLGGMVGWEREAAGKWVGLRTQMLVCMATMLFVRLGQMLIAESASQVAPVSIRADPVHIIAAIATGISFLGAGAIFHTEGKSKGLTTAAGLMVTASIGVAVAMDRYIIAVGVTLLCLFVLHTLRKLETKLTSSRKTEEGTRAETSEDAVAEKKRK
jgi:putative Mg2+ transporter-C (MgtC) family protein